MKLFKQSMLALTMAGLSVASFGALAQDATSDSLTIGLTANIEDLIRVDLSTHSVTIQQDNVGDWFGRLDADVSRRGASADNEMGFGIEVTGLAAGDGKDFWLNPNQINPAQSIDEQRIAMRISYENRPGGSGSRSSLSNSQNKFEHGQRVEMRTQTCVTKKTRDQDYNVGMDLRIPEEYVRNSAPGEYSTTLTFLVTAI